VHRITLGGTFGRSELFEKQLTACRGVVFMIAAFLLLQPSLEVPTTSDTNLICIALYHMGPCSVLYYTIWGHVVQPHLIPI